MKPKIPMLIAATMLFASLASPAWLFAQQPRYKLIDLGTLGGPQSYVYMPNNYAPVLNDRSTVAGWADTSTTDPFPAFCFNEDCYVSHAFQWHAGVRTDLGALVDGVSSQSTWISSNGLIAGTSQNGETDPLFPGFPENHAVLWRNGHITDLGTLPEGGYESGANAVNSKGQVIGWATNTIPDPYSMIAPGFLPTQTRALYERGDGVRFGKAHLKPSELVSCVALPNQAVRHEIVPRRAGTKRAAPAKSGSPRDARGLKTC